MSAYKPQIFAGIAMALFCACCQAAPSKTNDAPIATLAFHDGGTLRGDRELFILTNGVCVTRVVRPPKAGETGMQERRCQVQLERRDLDSLQRLINQHFFTLTIKDRTGVPDEARTTMQVRLASGQQREVSKWTRDPHRDFDPIYQYLVRLITRVQQSPPVYAGLAVYNWKPEGFNQLVSEARVKPTAFGPATLGKPTISVLFELRHYLVSDSGTRSSLRVDKTKGGVTYSVPEPFHLLSSADTNQMPNVRGFVFEIISPPAHAGNVLTAHFDGIAASGHPFEAFAFGRRYQADILPVNVGSTNFGLCY